jgi:hypothetical protein
VNEVGIGQPEGEGRGSRRLRAMVARVLIGIAVLGVLALIATDYVESTQAVASIDAKSR